MLSVFKLFFFFLYSEKTKVSPNLDKSHKACTFQSHNLTSFYLKSIFILGLSLPHVYALLQQQGTMLFLTSSGL